MGWAWTLIHLALNLQIAKPSCEPLFWFWQGHFFFYCWSTSDLLHEKSWVSQVIWRLVTCAVQGSIAGGSPETGPKRVIAGFKLSKLLPQTRGQRESFFLISRREWEILLLNLAHRDETESFWHLISCFETRPRKNVLQSGVPRWDRDLSSTFSGFETRSRIPLIWSQFSWREREF